MGIEPAGAYPNSVICMVKGIAYILITKRLLRVLLCCRLPPVDLVTPDVPLRDDSPVSAFRFAGLRP
jgi:hypothetical protein